VSSRAQLTRASAPSACPACSKTRRLGYDAKGQAVIHTAADVRRAWARSARRRLLYEEWVPFECEASIIGARSGAASSRLSAVRTSTRGNPATHLCALRSAALAAPGRALSHPRVAHFRYTGILTLEFFVRRGRLIANEMAPRVHNSNWTIEGATTSQFENHLRASSICRSAPPARWGQRHDQSHRADAPHAQRSWRWRRAPARLRQAAAGRRKVATAP